jgi:hypothetical protein
MDNLDNYLWNLRVPEMKSQLDELDAAINEQIKNDSEYDGEADMLLAVIANLKEELQDVKDIKKLSLREQARIAADINLMTMMTNVMYGEEEEDEDFEWDDSFEDDDFDEEDSHKEPKEIEEQPKKTKDAKLNVKKGGSSCCNHNHHCH